MDDLLTVAEVADVLKLNPQTIRNWIDRDELAAVRLGKRRVRIRQSDLDAFIEASSNAPSESMAEAVDEGSLTAWASFGAAMAEATATLESEDRRDLLRAIEALAVATTELARVLPRT